MNEKIQKTLKSAETEDWLDLPRSACGTPVLLLVGSVLCQT